MAYCVIKHTAVDIQFICSSATHNTMLLLCFVVPWVNLSKTLQTFPYCIIIIYLHFKVLPRIKPWISLYPKKINASEMLNSVILLSSLLPCLWSFLVHWYIVKSFLWKPSWHTIEEKILLNNCCSLNFNSYYGDWWWITTQSCKWQNPILCHSSLVI